MLVKKNASEKDPWGLEYTKQQTAGSGAYKVTKWTAGTEVVSSIPRSEQLERHGKDPHARQKKDTDQYANFRARMAEQEYRQLYRLRPSIAEFPNADCRNRNLRQFRIRGLAKVKAVVLWYALAFNFLRMINLGALAAKEPLDRL